jgi:uncharacterized protein (TIGR03435 family)
MRRAIVRPVLGFLACAVLCAQSGQPTFEVVSVKPSPPVPPSGGVYFGPPRGGPGTADPSQIAWTYATMGSLLTTAYDVKAFQVDGPAWLSTERYDIVAKLPAGATKDQVPAMWRSLLAERFGLMLHHESREFQVEELVIAKGGAKLKETADDLLAALPPGPPRFQDGKLLSAGAVSMIFPGPPPKAHTVARAQPISHLTTLLTNQLNRPVLDKTGLTGRYDYSLDFAVRSTGGVPVPPAAPGAAPDPDAPPDLTAAIQQQLGLRLVAAKAKLDVIVIDKLEKLPTAN